MQALRPLRTIRGEQDAWWSVPASAVLAATGLGFPMVVGFLLEHQYDVWQERDRGLPDWSCAPQYMMAGMRLLAGAALMSGPAIVLVRLAVGATGVEPAFLLQGLSGLLDPGSLDPDYTTLALLIAGFGALAGGLYLGPAVCAFNAHGSILKLFDVREILLGIWRATTPYLLAYALTSLSGIALVLTALGITTALSALPSPRIAVQLLVLPNAAILLALASCDWWGQYMREVYGVSRPAEDHPAGWHHLEPACSPEPAPGGHELLDACVEDAAADAPGGSA
ncbi:MAG: DUF4013 domain-containing protein [Coriobacteriia bacterium]|nr:DUF4013 domain-containing protein [Coriobacteriia bacterium]